MSAIVSLADWYQAQSPVYLTPENTIRYAWAKQTYAWTTLLRGKKMETLLSGGTDIRWNAALTQSTGFVNYQPNEPLSSTREEIMSTLKADWRFGEWSIQWTKNEELLNGGSADFSKEARVLRYFDFMVKKETEFQYKAVQGVEDSLFAVPDKNLMESPSGIAPYSLPALINDHANTLFNPGSSVASGAWTTVENESPVTKPRHRNRIFGYTSNAVKPTSGTKNILGAMDAAYIRLQYRAPMMKGAKAPQSWEDDGWSRKVGWCSQTGLEKLMEMLRQRNDSWNGASGELGMGDVNYKGMEWYAIPALETGAYYPSSYTTPTGVLVTEGGGTVTGTNEGPRYYILDTDSFDVIFHRERFFAREAPRQPDNQPFTNVVWGDVYYQFVNKFRWLTAIISPGTVTGSFDLGTELLTATNGVQYAY